jgi:hypothetical protein
MRARLQIPFRDAAAADLAWALEPDAPTPATLARVDLAAGACSVSLHVLGASHAVELTLPDGTRLTETVACGLSGGRPLTDAPDRLELDGTSYAFSAHVDEPGTDAVVALARELHDHLTTDPHGVVATFPGAPGAATGLRARVERGGVAWDTWHLYPERGEVVRTRTLARPLTGGPASIAAAAAVPTIGVAR